jgi:hypothetical protein
VPEIKYWAVLVVDIAFALAITIPPRYSQSNVYRYPKNVTLTRTDRYLNLVFAIYPC